MSLVVCNVVLPSRHGYRPGALRAEGPIVVAIGPTVARRPGDEVIDGGGGVVGPGLHDHHVHLGASAAALGSVDVGPGRVDGPAGLARALRASAAASAGRWVRAVGYHESVAGPLDRHAIDSAVSDVPVRIQHRTGALWMLNSAALARIRLPEMSSAVERDDAGRPTGRLWRADRLVAASLAAAGARPDDDSYTDALRWVAAHAASLGITGFTDADPERPDDDLGRLADASAAGVVPQRLHLMLRPGTPGRALAPLHGTPGVTAGPVKVLLDDDRLPTIDALAAVVAAAHRAGRNAAVHCVTAVQTVVALTAFADAGTVAGDRLEHAAVVDPSLVARVRDLGLTVVTQPGLVAARGDSYLRDVEAVDIPDLWRAGSLERAGCVVACGTDAPHGPADPWTAMATAVSRRTASGVVLGPAERVDARTARRWWEGRADAPGVPRRLAPGEPADLIVTAVPGPGHPEAEVWWTVVAGRVVHRRTDTEGAPPP